MPWSYELAEIHQLDMLHIHFWMRIKSEALSTLLLAFCATDWNSFQKICAAEGIFFVGQLSICIISCHLGGILGIEKVSKKKCV